MSRTTRRNDFQATGGAGTYVTQAWDGSLKLVEVDGVSLDAARHIAMAHWSLGFVCRIMANGSDYCEVYDGEQIRRGTFAQTTLVRHASQQPATAQE